MQIPNAILIPEIIRLLDEGHTVTLRLRGYSMRPFLEDDRDVALLVKGGGALPTEGREGGGHRILPQRAEDDGPHGRLEMEGV